MNLNEFLINFKKQYEPALLISNNITTDDIDDFKAVSSDFTSLFDALSQGGLFISQLTSSLSKEIYDLIKQYTDRKDEVSVFTDGLWNKTVINTQTTKLLLLVDTDTLVEIEKEYPIRQVVGMVFVCNQ